jgi:hypothetical protein
MRSDYTIFLASDTVCGVLASYSVNSKGEGDDVKLFKTFDPSLQVGDFLIVPTETRHKMTVVRVEAVDVEPDFDSDQPCLWVIGKIPPEYATEFHRLKSQEGDMLAKIKEGEKRRRREELRKDYINGDMDEIRSMPLIANNSGAVSPAPREFARTPAPDDDGEFPI